MAMASRGLRPKLLLNLPHFTKHLNSALPSPVALNIAQRSIPVPPKPIPTPSTDHAAHKILNLEDVKKLFTSVSTSKLIRSSITLQMAAFEPMVDLGTWIMNSKLMEMPISRWVILESVKQTFYDHFCAGQDLEEVKKTMIKLQEDGLKGMLDYGLEHATDNESCDQNLEEFIKTIESTKSLPQSSISFVVVKISAICNPSLLTRASDLLRWEYKDSSLSLPWKHTTLPIFCDSSPLYHTTKKPEPLTSEEERHIQMAYERLQKICEKCVETNVRLLIDAEDTIVQPAIDCLTYSVAIKYHNDNGPLVFNTIQAYLKDAKERLVSTAKAAEKIGVPIGFKLVRGAYMSSEKQLAASLGAESPIHDSIHQTHACYNGCASFMLEQVAKGSSAIVLATHNVESGKLAAAKATDLGIRKDNQNLQFAQLYGMAAVLSFGLRDAGFQVSKYLPFGPIDQIMPYLMRRAEENRGLLSSSSIDRELMRKELKRRLKSRFV